MGFQIVNVINPINNISVPVYYPYTYDASADVATYSYDVKFSASGTEMYIVSQSDNAIITMYTLSTPWDVRTATYDSIEYLNAGNYEANGIKFNDDGSILYILNYDVGIYWHVQQYDLSTPYDITTARINYAKRYDGSIAHVQDLAFKADGTKMYVICGSSSYNKVYQFSLGTAWDVSTATYDSISVTATETYPLGLWFKPDGTKMWTCGEDNYVYEYDLSPAWDITSASYTSGHGKADTVLSQPNLEAVVFSSDGLNMYVQGTYALTWYTLGTAWTASTATQTGYINTTYIGGMDEAKGLTIDSTGSYLYIISAWPAVPRIIRIEMSTPYDLTTGVFNGVEYRYQLLTEQTTCVDFNYDFDRMIAISEYGGTVSQLDLLTQDDIGTIDGDSQYEYKVGKIQSYEYQTSSYVSPDGNHAYTADTYWGNIYQWDLDTAYDLTTAQFVSLITMPKSYSIVIGDSGTKLYLMDYTYWYIIYEFTLDSAWNLNSIDYSSIKIYDYSTQTTFAFSFTISDDGYNLYIVVGATQYQYTMSTAWDLSTISYTRSQALSYSAVSIAFKSDGTKLYAGNSAGTIHQYTLGTAWDLSTVSYDSVSYAYTGQPDSLQFSSDGTKLYIFNGDNDSIELHTLGTAWDLSTASSGSDTLDPYLQNVLTNAVTYGARGEKLYVTNYNYGTVREFDLATPYDISTATYTENERNDLDGSGALQAVGFNSIGLIMYTNINNGWQKHLLSLPWDISTASYDSDILTDSSPSSINIEISTDNKFLYDVNSDGVVSQYLLPTDETTNSALKQVALGGTKFRVFNVDDMTSWSEITYTDTAPGITGVSGLDFSPDGSLLARGFGASPYIFIYDTTTHGLTATQPTVTGGITELRFSPDGTKLACPGPTTMSIYNVSDWSVSTTITTPDASHCCAWSPDGAYLAVGHNSGNRWSIYDTSDGSLHASPSGISSTVQGIEWNKYWNIIQLTLTGDPYNATFTWPSLTYGYYTDKPLGIGEGLRYSPDGKLLAITHRGSRYLSLYRIQTGTRYADPSTLPTTNAYSVDFTRDGKYMLVGWSSYPYLYIYEVGDFTVLPDVNSSLSLPLGTSTNHLAIS